MTQHSEPQSAAPRIVILTGSGISAESGISTFRDANGLWEDHRIEDVASPEGFAADPGTVQRFYNARRAQLNDVVPNDAHLALAKLERALPGQVTIITQNVDDLHEAAGSSEVIHVHGRLRSALCMACDRRAEHRGDLSDESQCAHCGERALRPDIVWFGESIYEGERIYDALSACTLFAVIGTSGTVYPAAGFAVEARQRGAHTVLINLDPHDDASAYDEVFTGLASQAVPQWVDAVIARHARQSPKTTKPDSVRLGCRLKERS